MQNSISGIHHVTAIAGDPQANVDFYAGVLGLRLVKLTVAAKYSDPSVMIRVDQLLLVRVVGWPTTGDDAAGPGLVI